MIQALQSLPLPAIEPRVVVAMLLLWNCDH
jgi:hypothetical protein